MVDSFEKDVKDLSASFDIKGMIDNHVEDAIRTLSELMLLGDDNTRFKASSFIIDRAIKLKEAHSKEFDGFLKNVLDGV